MSNLDPVNGTHITYENRGPINNPWLYFVLIQVASLLCTMAGIVLLIIPCALRSWSKVKQIYQPDWAVKGQLPKTDINVWSWKWLNKVWGNDEDGVTGPSWYNDSAGPSVWLAYKWSALRNPANNLRFIFRLIGGPFYRWENTSKTWYFQAGWYPNGFPVLSAGKT